MRLRTLLLVISLVFVFSSANAQPTTAQSKGKAKSGSQNAASFFNGAWQGTMGESKSFFVIHEGYFNFSSIDLAGKWESTTGETYTVNGDSTITFKVLYSSRAEHIGAQNIAEYSILGQTVKLRHFKKLLDKEGNDITDQMPKNMVETMVRMK